MRREIADSSLFEYLAMSEECLITVAVVKIGERKMENTSYINFKKKKSEAKINTSIGDVVNRKRVQV